VLSSSIPVGHFLVLYRSRELWHHRKPFLLRRSTGTVRALSFFDFIPHPANNNNNNISIDQTTMSSSSTPKTATTGEVIKEPPTFNEIMNKAAASAVRGGTAGAVAMGANVACLMWMRTTVSSLCRCITVGTNNAGVHGFVEKGVLLAFVVVEPIPMTDSAYCCFLSLSII
jgi:hypothetical protein